jgi:hypothetical protein
VIPTAAKFILQKNGSCILQPPIILVKVIVVIKVVGQKTQQRKEPDRTQTTEKLCFMLLVGYAIPNKGDTATPTAAKELGF